MAAGIINCTVGVQAARRICVCRASGINSGRFSAASCRFNAETAGTSKAAVTIREPRISRDVRTAAGEALTITLRSTYTGVGAAITTVTAIPIVASRATLQSADTTMLETIPVFVVAINETAFGAGIYRG